MATVTREPFSGSTDYQGIKVVATATPGTLIHTAHASLDDELYLYVVNSDTVGHKLTLEWGGVTSPDNLIEMGNIPPESGLIPVCLGLCIQNARVVRAFADVANLLMVYGHVNRITN